MPSDTEEKIFKIGHSPDPDDAFMFYALAACSERVVTDLVVLRPFLFVTEHGCANFMPTHDEVMAFVDSRGGL